MEGIFDGRCFLDVLVWLISKCKGVHCLLVKIQFLFSPVIFGVHAWKKNVMVDWSQRCCYHITILC
jgi:hypothetical protein